MVKWDLQASADEEFSREGFMPAASKRYLTSLADYIAALVKPGEVGALIVLVVEELRELASEAEGYSTHFKTVEVQHAAFIADRENPDQNTLYILWDMQDR